VSKIVDEIKKPIAIQMVAFENKFKDAMQSSVPLLDKITNYILKRKGKQIRPMLVFLSAQINGEINETTHRAASLIELLHTATLVHDDVVDDSNERRGFFSINALWKNKIAVLIGDFLVFSIVKFDELFWVTSPLSLGIHTCSNSIRAAIKSA
jgi:octaprenyl-diphosphate synthase